MNHNYLLKETIQMKNQTYLNVLRDFFMNITACLSAEIESCQMKIIRGIQILEFI